jgi:hypothetical protein
MEVWGVNKLKDPNSNHIIRKVIKRREQLLQREQTPTVIKQLKYLDKRMEIGKMLLDRWYETHLDNRLDNCLPNRLDNRLDNRLNN